MARTTAARQEPETNENVYRMSTEAIEAWLAEGDALKATFRERLADQKRRREQRDEVAA
jgi:hypothetical protein